MQGGNEEGMRGRREGGGASWDLVGVWLEADDVDCVGEGGHGHGGVGDVESVKLDFV